MKLEVKKTPWLLAASFLATFTFNSTLPLVAQDDYNVWPPLAEEAPTGRNLEELQGNALAAVIQHADFVVHAARVAPYYDLEGYQLLFDQFIFLRRQFTDFENTLVDWQWQRGGDVLDELETDLLLMQRQFDLFANAFALAEATPDGLANLCLDLNTELDDWVLALYETSARLRVPH